MFKKKSFLPFMLILAASLIFTACGNNDSQESWNLIVETPDKTVTITQDDVEKIGLVDVQATLRNKDGAEEENLWTGMVIKDILDFAGIKDYSSLEVEAIDGFTVEYDPQILASDGTILALKVDGKELDKDSGPLQSVVEGQGQNLWIRQVVKLNVSQ